MGLGKTFGLQPDSEMILEMKKLRTNNKMLLNQLYDSYSNDICSIKEHK